MRNTLYQVKKRFNGEVFKLAVAPAPVDKYGYNKQSAERYKTKLKAKGHKVRVIKNRGKYLTYYK